MTRNIFISFTLLTICVLLQPFSLALAQAPVYPAQIIAEYPHNPETSTQGLLYHEGQFYESSGGFGKSFLAIVDPATGKQTSRSTIENQFFAEGLALHNRQLYLLTWMSGTGFIHNMRTLAPERRFSYRPANETTEGWGLTNNGEQFILSCGTSTLYTHRFSDFTRTGSILVRDGNTPVSQLNELEYINGQVFANIWKSDKIAIINPRTGFVTHWIDLSPLRARISKPCGVANGIAYDAVSRKLYVTGKHWDKLFEITIENAPW